MKREFFTKSFAVAMIALAVAGCKKDDSPSDAQPTVRDGQFLVAAVADAVTYFLPAQKLDDENANITIVNNGLPINNTYTFYLSEGFSGLTALKYGQGNAHVGQRVTINHNTGKAETIGAEFELEGGLVTSGKTNDYIFSIMSGPRSADPTAATFNRIKVGSSDLPQNQAVPVNAYQGYAGKNAQLIGLADAGNNSFFTSAYFWEDATINDVVVVKYNADLQVQAVLKDSRLSFSGGLFRSARHGQIGTADNGDVFVFSGGHNGTKKAGALKIASGATAFDSGYYFDIQTKSGGYGFRKVWHLTSDKFLLEFYSEPIVANTTITGTNNRYAVVDMSDQSLTWLDGNGSAFPAPALIPTDGINNPYYYNGKVYLGVTTTGDAPRFYVLDVATMKITKGAAISGGATSIEAATFVEKK